MTTFAEKELAAIGLTTSHPEANIRNAVVAILHTVNTFESATIPKSHRGTAAELLSLLIKGAILSPLQGTEEEWELLSKEGEADVWRNRRMRTVMRTDDMRCFDTRGKVFITLDGEEEIHGTESCVQITFPYTPYTEYIHMSSTASTH